MKQIFWKCYIPLSLFLFLIGCQGEEMSDIGNSKSYSIYSSFTKEEYDLRIMYPKSYDKTKMYQTIYLLDGGWYFDELAEIIEDKYSDDIILIGIGYKNENKRNSDFTFPEDDILDDSGNAKNYIQFLNKELIPYINDLSIKSSQKTLVGHSLAGYFALYFIFQDEFQNPFDNVISASPSLFWHNAYLFDLENEYHMANDKLNMGLYITMGDSEGVTMNTLFDAFNEKIESRKYTDLTFHYDRFENTVHNNNAIKSFEKGIRILLK